MRASAGLQMCMLDLGELIIKISLPFQMGKKRRSRSKRSRKESRKKYYDSAKRYASRAKDNMEENIYPFMMGVAAGGVTTWALMKTKRGRAVSDNVKNMGKLVKGKIMRENELYSKCYFVTMQIYNACLKIYDTMVVSPSFFDSVETDPATGATRTPGQENFMLYWNQWTANSSHAPSDSLGRQGLLDFKTFLDGFNRFVPKLKGKHQELIIQGSKSYTFLQQLWICFSKQKNPDDQGSAFYMWPEDFKRLLDHVGWEAIAIDFDV